MGTQSKHAKNRQRRSRCAVAPGSLRRRRAEKRFNELVCLHALGKATPAEEALLDRYQALRRVWLGSAYSTPEQARQEYKDRMLLKKLRALTRSASENNRDEPRA
jgi:uncharacterized protein YqjF (DUF2071 family)